MHWPFGNAISALHLPQYLFTTNKPPNDEELFKVREAIKAANARLETVQRMITKLEEENKLLKTIEAYRNIASPLRRVPDDVLGEILLACTDGLPKVDINIAPLLFLRISQRTRQLALNLPRLWAGITIYSYRAWEKVPFDPVASRREKSYLALISLWLLVRSAAMPLRISVRGDIRDESTFTHANEDGLLAILFQCKTRWQDIGLSLSNDKPIALFIAQVNETGAESGHLRSLSLKLKRVRYGVINFSGDGLRLFAPNLTRLRLECTHAVNLTPASLEWTKLTSLRLCGSLNTLGPLLRQASSIKVLSINCVAKSTDAETYVAGIIHFPYLAELGITEYDTMIDSLAQMHAFMGIIDAPLLKTLTLEREDYINEQSFSTLLSRIRCLEILKIGGVDLEVMPRILCQIPTLKELYITNREVYNSETLNAFLDAFDNGNVCPHLQVLQYEELLHADKMIVDRFRTLRKNLHRRRHQH